MSRTISLIKFCVEVCRSPGGVPKLVDGWGAPMVIAALSGVVFLWPIAFFLASYQAEGLFLAVSLSIVGVPVMAAFWIYSGIVVFALSRLFSDKVDRVNLFKIVGICLSPLFLGGLINVLVAVMFFRSPLSPNFIVMLLSLAYFVYCVTKALEAELKDSAYVVGLLYTVITLILWFTVKV